MSDEVDQSTTMYPVRSTSHCISGVEMFHILLKTTRGQKYVAIYVAPMVSDDSVQLDHGALKLVFFSKVDYNVSLPFHKVVGKFKWPVSPRNDPLIMAAARFALAQHNKEEKLARLIRATSQMVGEHDIFRMTFEGEFSGGSRNYDAIVLVPRNNPEKMELVRFGISDGWRMYRPLMHPVRRYCYVDEDEYESESEEDEDEDEDENDPRVTEAARFALTQHNKDDRVLRVVEATRRMYSGDEILSMRFDGQLDGSIFYEAIVLVPVNDPGNMRLAYVRRNGDEYYPDDYYVVVAKERFMLHGGFEECSVDDPRVIEAARLALTRYNKKDKLLRVVEAASRNDSECKSYKVKFVGEYHPLRTYEAILKGHIKEPDPKKMWVEYVFPELSGPIKNRRVSPKV